MGVNNGRPIIDRQRAYSDALFSYGRFPDITITAFNEQLAYIVHGSLEPFLDA